MKLAILDKDGTLTQPKSGAQFVESPEDQELMPGVEEAIAKLVAAGYVIAVVSNQWGCTAKNPATGKPHKSMESAIEEMKFVGRLIPEIQVIYFCPDDGNKLVELDYSPERTILGDANISSYQRQDHDFYIAGGRREYASFRKPNPGMLHWAMQKFSSLTEPVEAFYIGDRSEDLNAAYFADIPFLHADTWRSGDPCA